MSKNGGVGVNTSTLVKRELTHYINPFCYTDYIAARKKQKPARVALHCHKFYLRQYGYRERVLLDTPEHLHNRVNINNTAVAGKGSPQSATMLKYSPVLCSKRKT